MASCFCIDVLPMIFLFCSLFPRHLIITFVSVSLSFSLSVSSEPLHSPWLVSLLLIMFNHINDSSIVHLRHLSWTRCSYQFYFVVFCETSVEVLAGLFLDSHHQEKILYPICAIHFLIQAVFIFASFLQSRGAYLCQSGASKKQKPRNISKETPVRKHRPEILRVYEENPGVDLSEWGNKGR